MRKILVVDDEEDILFSVKYGLENSSDNYEIYTANDGIKCLDVINRDIPDLILLDLMMPNMNGWKVLDKIQENPIWRDIPIFIVTAAVDPEFRIYADELGITYIEKPFDIKFLKNRIDNFFDKK